MKKLFALFISVFLVLSCFCVCVSADTSITDLSGLIIRFNDFLDIDNFALSGVLPLDFVGNSEYAGLEVVGGVMFYYLSADDYQTAYDYGDWYGSRLIYVIGGEYATNADFISWVLDNATVYDGSSESDTPVGIYNDIYDLISSFVFGGTVAPGSVQFLACSLISVIACVFVVILPFLVVWKVIRFLCG